MTNPTRPNLADIEARANAATEGPWCTDAWEIYQGTEYQPGLSMWIGETCRGTSTPEQDQADAAFVAAARTDVPALLAEVRRLQAELAAVTALCDEQDMAARMFELPQPEWIRAVRAAINAEESHAAAPAPAAASAAGESGSTR